VHRIGHANSKTTLNATLTRSVSIFQRMYWSKSVRSTISPNRYYPIQTSDSVVRRSYAARPVDANGISAYCSSRTVVENSFSEASSFQNSASCTVLMARWRRYNRWVVVLPLMFSPAPMCYGHAGTGATVCRSGDGRALKHFLARNVVFSNTLSDECLFVGV